MKTDFNTLSSNAKSGNLVGHIVNIAFWNNYHAQLGANITKRKFNLRAGQTLTYGHMNHYFNIVNFDTAKDNNLLMGDNVYNKSATHFVIGAILSYVHNL